jgi:hypothetical protein
LTRMINVVTTGKCLGRLDASDNGTTVPTVHSPLRGAEARNTKL